MVEVPRRDINRGKMLYRKYHMRLRYFNYGWSNFDELIEMDSSARRQYNYETWETITLTECGASKLAALLNSSPDNMWVMLKAAVAKHS